VQISSDKNLVAHRVHIGELQINGAGMFFRAVQSAGFRIGLGAFETMRIGLPLFSMGA
jgi:hypothetical protein